LTRPMTTVAATTMLATTKPSPTNTATPSFSTMASAKMAMPQAGSQLAKGIGKVRIKARMRMARPTSLSPVQDSSTVSPVRKPGLVAPVGELRRKQDKRKAEDRRQQRDVDRHEVRQREDEEQNAEAAVAERVTQGPETDAGLGVARHEVAQKLRGAPGVRRRQRPAQLTLSCTDVVHHAACSAPPKAP
jgi:hypothetical protein